MRSITEVEIVGPFQERRLVVDGWAVPLVQAHEGIGGKVTFVIDGRLGYTFDAGAFENAARMLADGIAVALGLGAHPRGDIPKDERAEMFARVPHPAMAPRRMIGIDSVATEDVEMPDDPRDD